MQIFYFTAILQVFTLLKIKTNKEKINAKNAWLKDVSITFVISSPFMNRVVNFGLNITKMQKIANNCK